MTSAHTRTPYFGRQGQTPPDLEIQIGVADDTLQNALDPYIRIISVGHAAKGNYTAHTEYWYDCHTRIPPGDLRLKLENIEIWSDARITASVTGFTLRFTHARVVPASDWVTGTRIPSGSNSLLFKMVDPDQLTTHLGILVEQDSMGDLQRVTWYKTWRPANGQIWSTNPPSPATLILVVNESGVPTTDPAYIDSTATWHRFEQGV